MKKEIFPLALLLGLTACSVLSNPSPPSVIASTAVTAPPFTPVVFSTVLPPTSVPPSATATFTRTSTATATSTATPNVTPTPNPNLNVKDEIYNDQFTGKSGWLWTFKDETAEFGAVNGELRAKAKQSNKGWRYSLRFDRNFSNVQLQVTAKVTQCGEADEYGVTFRGNENPANQYNMYVFKLNCAGSARVDLLQGTKAVSLTEWKPYPAIQKGKEAQNVITIWMFKEQFHFFVNEKFLFSLQDKTWAEGFVGFYLSDRSTGSAAVTYTNFVLKAIAP